MIEKPEILSDKELSKYAASDYEFRTEYDIIAVLEAQRDKDWREMLEELLNHYTFSSIYNKEWYINRKGGAWVFISEETTKALQSQLKEA